MRVHDDEARDALVKKISAAMADGKDSGGYETLLDMYAHIALKVIEEENHHAEEKPNHLCPRHPGLESPGHD
jgi:hypothetical protein